MFPALGWMDNDEWGGSRTLRMVSLLTPSVPAEETQSPLLPVNSSQQEYCITNDGDVLLVGDSWKANACTSCTCNNGTIQCFSQSCPAANCRVPVLRKGQCCPHCLGEYCSLQGSRHQNRWNCRNEPQAVAGKVQTRPLAGAFHENGLLASCPGFLYGSAGRSEAPRQLSLQRNTPAAAPIVPTDTCSRCFCYFLGEAWLFFKARLRTKAPVNSLSTQISGN